MWKGEGRTDNGILGEHFSILIILIVVVFRWSKFMIMHVHPHYHNPNEKIICFNLNEVTARGKYITRVIKNIITSFFYKSYHTFWKIIAKKRSLLSFFFFFSKKLFSLLMVKKSLWEPQILLFSCTLAGKNLRDYFFKIVAASYEKMSL